MSHRIVHQVAVACLLSAASHFAAAQQDDVVARSRAKYAALRSYADTGTIVVETTIPGAPTLVERRRFVTYYRAPRQFYFDFRKGLTPDAERLVIWCDGGDFNTWWSATQVHEVYAKGRGGYAFAVSTYPTDGSATLVAPLLFAQAGLHGSLADFANYHVAAVEDVGGRRAYKVVGEVNLAFQNGAAGEPTQTTIWIDAETLLVRRIVQETRAGGRLTGRGTATLAPVADPALADALFRFSVPKS
jgi:outer membrane lipoprotein-sorting protein